MIVLKLLKSKISRFHKVISYQRIKAAGSETFIHSDRCLEQAVMERFVNAAIRNRDLFEQSKLSEKRLLMPRKNNDSLIK